jgi:SAM-dependent methyltransferase
MAGLDLAHAPEPRVLDVGSGLGDLLIDVHAEFPQAKMVGLELSHTGVDIATRRLPQAQFLQRDLIAGNADPGNLRGFGTHAVCSEVLEHIDDPVGLLRSARNYMADGCRLVVTVPGGPRSAYDLHIGHRRHFSATDLRTILEQAGFQVEIATGAGFPFFNLYRLLVILRGQRLVEDAAGKPSALLTYVSAAFRGLFALNLPRSPLGWQTIAVARK